MYYYSYKAIHNYNYLDKMWMAAKNRSTEGVGLTNYGSKRCFYAVLDKDRETFLINAYDETIATLTPNNILTIISSAKYHWSTWITRIFPWFESELIHNPNIPKILSSKIYCYKSYPLFKGMKFNIQTAEFINKKPFPSYKIDKQKQKEFSAKMNSFGKQLKLHIDMVKDLMEFSEREVRDITFKEKDLYEAINTLDTSNYKVIYNFLWNHTYDTEYSSKYAIDNGLRNLKTNLYLMTPGLLTKV